MKVTNMINIKLEELIALPLIDLNYFNFDFDPHSLEEIEKMRLIWIFFQSENYLQNNKIPLEEFCTFLSLLNHHYNKRSNPFHNFNHGIQVMHGTYMISHKTRAANFL